MEIYPSLAPRGRELASKDEIKPRRPTFAEYIGIARGRIVICQRKRAVALVFGNSDKLCGRINAVRMGGMKMEICKLFLTITSVILDKLNL